MNVTLTAQNLIRSNTRIFARHMRSGRILTRSISSNSSTSIAFSRNLQSSQRITLPQLRCFSSTSQRRQESENEEEKREKTSGEQDIEDILNKQFSPKHLQVQDVSGGCGSFYQIIIASSHFKGMSTIKAHRLVNAALKDIIKDIHGLQLRTMSADD